MLSCSEAIKKIVQATPRLKARSVLLREALGLVLARGVRAPEPSPAFDNSAVDGYAVNWCAGTPIGLQVEGEIPAGACPSQALKPGQAVRIFTGAPVPPGAQAVVMQEHTERRNGSVFLLKAPRLKENIRFRGEDFQKGKVLIPKGTTLGPAHLSLLAALGYKEAQVFPRPSAAIFSTGDELLKQGEKRAIGKIWDSNTVLLETLVEEAGGFPGALDPARDCEREIRKKVRAGLKRDVLLISGGVSAGRYDWVKEALKKEGVREIFWKVDIKPGKPVFFGKKKNTLVFGLPGNPVSVFVTFEIFVKPALLQMMAKQPSHRRVEGRLTRGFQNGPRFHFVRVRSVPKRKGFAIEPLKGQGSHMLGSLAQADGIWAVPPRACFRKNEKVTVERIGED